MEKPINFNIDNDDVYSIERLADDEFGEIVNQVFFFGKIIDDCICPNGSIDEECVYCVCPSCGELFKIEKFPVNGDSVYCPKCGQDGELYDFRDRNLPLDDYATQRYALLCSYQDGFLLRLFDVSLDYSERKYDNYKKLDYISMIAIYEVAREYWHRGTVRYYENLNREYVYCDDGSGFRQTDDVDDWDYWIVNYDNVFDPMGTSVIADIIHDNPYHSSTFMEFIAHRIHYKTFCTLKKYGFDCLNFEQIYVANVFCDSAKISEILAADYNQIRVHFQPEQFGVSELLAARELTKYGLPITLINVQIMQRLDRASEAVLGIGNARKTFKYLRNQLSRLKKTEIIKDYADYIRDCIKLGYDLNDNEIMYPSNLPAAHAKTSALVKIENNRLTEEGVRSVYERYHHLCEWTDGEYAVIMPRSCDEIVNEGVEQKHCVGGYCERVANGEDIILFVRRANNPDKGFYTMEIRPNMNTLAVVQCRGYKNEDESEEIAATVQAFIDRYEKWFNSRKVTAAPINLKRVYYKAVKKTSDGRYISAWDNKTEYVVGKEITAKMCEDPDRVAAQGIHVASLEFAKKYGDRWPDAAILEIEVDLNDAVIPDAKDQIRISRGTVLREVPMSELGEWGERHMKRSTAA